MTRRQFIKVLNIILIIATVVALADFLYLASVDKRFIRCADRGVIAGWERSEPESMLRDLNLDSDTGFIEEEYNAVSCFRGKTFRDEKLGSIAAEYIKALEDCREAIKTGDPAKSFNKFWARFSEPYGRRIRALYDLDTGNFEFLRHLPDIYSADRADMLLQGWALNKTAEIAFDRSAETENELTAKVTNDSGHRLEYVDLTVDLYDKNGEYLETVSAYEADIDSGASFTLRFYESEAGSTHEYVITAINCEKGD